MDDANGFTGPPPQGEAFIELDNFQHHARRLLIRRAAEVDPSRPRDACIPYQKFRDLADPEKKRWKGSRCTGIGPDLGQISKYEFQHGRPLASSIVVYAPPLDHPAPDFIDALCRDMLGMEVPPGQEFAFWRTRLAEFVSFWTTPGISLILTDSIDTMVRNALLQYPSQ
jgi:hypothetical protein